MPRSRFRSRACPSWFRMPRIYIVALERKNRVAAACCARRRMHDKRIACVIMKACIATTKCRGEEKTAVPVICPRTPPPPPPFVPLRSCVVGLAAMGTMTGPRTMLLLLYCIHCCYPFHCSGKGFLLLGRKKSGSYEFLYLFVFGFRCFHQK